MKSETVRFRNRDGRELAGVIERPLATPRAIAIFAHCFTCTKNLRAAREISAALAGRDIATLRFDFTGLGQSDGEFSETNFSSNVSDLVDAAEWLTTRGETPTLLVGHSLGGTAVLQAAAALPNVRAVVTIGSPAKPEHVARLFRGQRDAIERDGEAEVLLAGRPFRIRRQFVDDLEASGLPDSVASLGKALLIMHSPLDTIVSIDNASELYVAARHPKSFVSLDRADHLLSDPADARYAADVLSAWAERYLDQRSEADSDSNDPRAVTATTGIDGFKTALVSGPHRLVADEPTAIKGGTDTGPSPYDLLSAALASCTSMTLVMYARHKKLNVDHVDVEVRHDRVHADDCEHCEDKTAKIDRFRRRLSVSGELTAAERERLVEIADRCPVHRTLHSEILIETTMTDQGDER